MSHNYIIRWSPLAVIGKVPVDKNITLPKGYDLIKNLPEGLELIGSLWDFTKLDMPKIYSLHLRQLYAEIFVIVNESEASDVYLCCEYSKGIVDENIRKWLELRTATAE